MVDWKDVNRIKQVCQMIQNEQQAVETQQNLNSLLKDELILFNHECLSKKEILKLACQLLKDHGYVKEGFYEDVMQREEISASVLGGGVAVPHGMANFVERPAVVLVKSDRKIEWGEGSVDVIFLLALNFEDIQSTRAFFRTFYEMTMEKNSAKLIRGATTKEEIRQIFVMAEE
jgi:mannitol/fructose-specific phosphotransferase system IIA component (Ntr-type)